MPPNYRYTPVEKKEFSCPSCQKTFLSNKPNAIYCSKQCATITYSSFPYLPTPTVGTLGELWASTELLKQGYEVFRALSAAASCDLLAIKEGQIFRFEVKTGYHSKRTNALLYPNKNIRAENLIVAVHEDNLLVFIPELPIAFQTSRNYRPFP